MRKTVLVLISITFLLAGCQKSSPATEILHPTAMPVIPVSQKIEPAENYCVSCHMDQDQLIAAAKPEEMVESESSGAG